MANLYTKTGDKGQTSLVLPGEQVQPAGGVLRHH